MLAQINNFIPKRLINVIPVSGILNILIVISIFVVILGLIVDIINTLNYGGIDLRNKIVGIRLLMEGLDPYFFNWNDSFSERLLDPLVFPNYITTRVTVPPTLLIFYGLIANLDYFPIRIIWLVLQWILFLITVYYLS